MSAMVSLTLPIPNSSKIPGSPRAETNSRTALRSCSELSNQLRVELKALVIAYPHPDEKQIIRGHHRSCSLSKLSTTGVITSIKFASVPAKVLAKVSLSASLRCATSITPYSMA